MVTKTFRNLSRPEVSGVFDKSSEVAKLCGTNEKLLFLQQHCHRKKKIVTNSLWSSLLGKYLVYLHHTHTHVYLRGKNIIPHTFIHTHTHTFIILHDRRKRRIRLYRYLGHVSFTKTALALVFYIIRHRS